MVVQNKSMKEKRTVIYIMSDTRSGSTLLENILSKSPQMVSVGELRLLESYANKGFLGHTLDWRCSCGEHFENCSFWSRIFQRLFNNDGYSKIESTVIKDNQKHRLFKYLSFRVRWNFDKNRPVLKLLDLLYKYVFEYSGKHVIIDSSKDPLQAMAICRKSDYDVKIIFLKRDIRAVVLSKKKWNKGKLYNTLVMSKLYDCRCRDVFSKVNENDRLYLRYEELVKDPQKALNRITEKFGLDTFAAPEYMFVENDHTVAGTPNKLIKRKIEYDDAWKAQISGKKIFNVVAKLLDKD